MTTSEKITPFQEKVYSYLQQIPKGRVTTYKDLANAISSSPRAVGNACKRNPFAPEIPCHRVISTTGYLGGYSGEWSKPFQGKCANKKELLKKEGVLFDEEGFLVDKQLFWKNFT